MTKHHGWTQPAIAVLCLTIVSLPFSTTKASAVQIKTPVVCKTINASWYGEAFAGKLTASGVPFDPNRLTAAHKSLPLGTKLIVSSPKTGKRCLVTVNDRGPYVAGRDLDLSKAAAEKLGILADGVQSVVISSTM